MGNNVLKPDKDEYHTRMKGTNPNKTEDGSNVFILDIMESLATARKENKIITSFHLEFTTIDDPDISITRITFAPDGNYNPEDES